MTEEYVITQTEFSIDSIDSYLLNTKNMLIKMNILLDTHEINKCLANSLNRALLQNYVTIEDIYKHISDNWDQITESIPKIEEKIRNFNKSQNYEYYVDMEDVFYIVFYKQIEYVKKILMETLLYLNSNVNLIFIYTFVIQAFYDEPNIFSNRYIFILNKLVNEENFGNTQIIKEFFQENKIKNLGFVLSLLYESDSKFSDLIENIRNDKISFIKFDIRVPIDKNYNNYNCVNKTQTDQSTDNEYSNTPLDGEKISTKSSGTNYILSKSIFNSTRDIEIIEKEFNKLKCNMLFEKRDISIEKIISGLQKLLSNEVKIARELWLGIMLFLYKKYTFDFDEFKKQVVQLLNANSYDEEFIPSTDTFKDLNLPDSIYVLKQNGGNINNKSNYFDKYLKYKAKYLKLKVNKK
jgi:hypothetical protein